MAGDPEADRFSTKAWPVEIRHKKSEKRLEIDFDDGAKFSYPAEYLRVESPSAEVQGHTPSQKKLISGRRHVGIMKMKPVGNYAVRIEFDDMHDTGIFSWKYLYELGVDYEARWQAYLNELDTKGLSRDP